jgi:hypothetical protein
MKTLRPIALFTLAGLLVVGLLVAPTALVLAQTAPAGLADGTGSFGIGGTNVTFNTTGGTFNSGITRSFVSGDRLQFYLPGGIQAGQMSLTELKNPPQRFTNANGYTISTTAVAGKAGCVRLVVKDNAGNTIVDSEICGL